MTSRKPMKKSVELLANLPDKAELRISRAGRYLVAQETGKPDPPPKLDHIRKIVAWRA